MSMFYNYDNLSPDYVPDNTSPKPSDNYLTIDANRLPKHVCNAKGTFIGYGWDHGDEFKMIFTIEEKIKVYEDSVIFYTSGMEPSVSTPGRPGSQCYNIADMKSWTCVRFDAGLYIWVEDDVLTYPEDGDKEIVIPHDMSNSTIQLDVFNTRWEKLHTFSSFGAANIVVSIDKDINKVLKSGTYYCTLRVTSGESSLLKDKFMFIVY